MAANSSAFYSENELHSIFYDQDDLKINVLFSSLDGPSKFINVLIGHFDGFGFDQIVNFENKVDEITLPSEYCKFVLLRDYIKKESDSDDFSISDTVRTHDSTVGISPDIELMMIENVRGDDFIQCKAFKCHLMGKTAFKEHKDNPNNILYMSWNTHQRFDGLNTTWEPFVPQIAIKFIEAGKIVSVPNSRDRVKVEICIECPNDEVLSIMQRRVKDGMRTVKNCIFTWVFVENAQEFERFLTYKYTETHIIWKTHNRGTELTKTEAHNLRVSARTETLSELKMNPQVSNYYKIHKLIFIDF